MLLVVADGVPVEDFPARFGHGEGGIEDFAKLVGAVEGEAIHPVAEGRVEDMSVFEDRDGPDRESLDQIMGERMECTRRAEEKAGISQAIQPGLGDNAIRLVLREKGGGGFGTGEDDGAFRVRRIAEAVTQVVSGHPKDIVTVEEAVAFRHRGDPVGVGILPGEKDAEGPPPVASEAEKAVSPVEKDGGVQGVGKMAVILRSAGDADANGTPRSAGRRLVVVVDAEGLGGEGFGGRQDPDTGLA